MATYFPQCMSNHKASPQAKIAYDEIKQLFARAHEIAKSVPPVTDSDGDRIAEICFTIHISMLDSGHLLSTSGAHGRGDQVTYALGQIAEHLIKNS